MPGSINQNAYTGALPNFRNLGILLRILVIVNIMAVAAAMLKSPTLRGVWGELLEVSALVQPLLFLSLLSLVGLNGILHRLPYYLGVLVVTGVELGLTVVLYVAGVPFLEIQFGSIERYSSSLRRCSRISTCAAERCRRRSRRRDFRHCRRASARIFCSTA